MSLITKLVMSLIVLGIAYFALKRIWTKEIDILALLRRPSESIPVKESPIVVVPGELKLTSSAWDKTEIIEVRNTGPTQTLYSVWTKIKGETSDFDLTDVEVSSDPGEGFIAEDIGGMNVDFEVLLIGALDKEGSPCIYLLTYKLKPLESRFFKVKRKASGEDKKKHLNLALNVIGYSDKPAPIASRKGEAGLQFTPPENLTVKSVKVLVKKGA